VAKRRQAFEESTREREASLLEREEAAKAQEAEQADLRKQVAAFPGQLEKEVRATEARAVKATEERFAFEKTLLERDTEHERKMFQATIATLQEKSKEQEARIRALEKDLKDSAAQAQSVTARAIEGIAGLRQAAAPAEGGREQIEPKRG
jgi:type I site-specific restriction-modification system R (restriction) subunit